MGCGLCGTGVVWVGGGGGLVGRGWKGVVGVR